MTRNLKTLGLALIALVAMGALTAGSASAAGEKFHSEKETTIVTGANVGNHVFTLESGSGLKVTCTGATFSGTQIKTGGAAGDFTATEVTLHPTYSGCTDNIFGAAAPVDTTGCNYVFKSETVQNGAGQKHISSAIECTSGYTIKVTSAGCTLSFGTQTPTDGVTLVNEGAGTTRDIKATATATATFSKSGILCGAVAGTTGVYDGVVTLKGYEDLGVSGPIDEVEGAAPGTDKTTVYTEGAHVGIWWQ